MISWGFMENGVDIEHASTIIASSGLIFYSVSLPKIDNRYGYFFFSINTFWDNFIGQHSILCFLFYNIVLSASSTTKWLLIYLNSARAHANIFKRINLIYGKKLKKKKFRYTVRRHAGKSFLNAQHRGYE